MRSKQIYFPATVYDFGKIVTQLFGINLADLDTLLTEQYKEQFKVGADSSTVFHKKFYDKYHEGWPELQGLYDKFIAEVIAPQYNEDFLYQKFPTFRVHLPGNVAVGAFHNDAEFGHPAGEVNYIIPLTNSDGTASVWVESEPGKKDFEPIEMVVGRLIQFSGNTLTHGNKMNETECTRVSMDFRVLPISKYDEANNSESVTLKTKFKEGEYYKRLAKATEVNKEEYINGLIKRMGADTNQISDGYHTFGQLYDHRAVLYIALCEMIHNYRTDKNGESFVWKSKAHSDGSTWEGWFLLGIGKEPGEQITYHLPVDKWDACEFVKELEKAPAFDGHTSDDVLQRLKSL